MNLLLVHSFTWVTVAVAAIISFMLGFIAKSAIIFKQRKRILQLEDEMLANHSSILELEKEISEMRKNSSQKEYDRPSRNDKLKAS